MSNATIRNLGLLEGFLQANTPTGFNQRAGMLVGDISGSSAISNSYATGTIRDSLTGEIGTESIGGLVGFYRGNTHSLRHSYADVDMATVYTVTDGSGSIGGLVGNTGTGTVEISDSYASGAVSANVGNIGGLLGRLTVGNEIDRNYSIGKLTNASGEAGFFTGNNAGTYADNFYNSEIVHSIGGTPVTQPNEVSPLTTAQMQSTCTAAEITAKTGICALGNAFQYTSGSYPKLYRLNPDDTISNTLLGGQ